MAARMYPSESEALHAVVSRLIGQAAVCLPGVLEEFDCQKQIAKVRPAIQGKVWDQNTTKFVPLPVLIHVPVVVPFAQMAGLLVTLPLRPKDEGLLVFADRMIDNFVEKGGVQPPENGGNLATEPRAHSITDGIFIPGIISTPQAVPDWQKDAIEMRTRTRNAFFRLAEDGEILVKTDKGITLDAGKDILIRAGGDITERGANIRMN